jgi:hypothetical protein
MPYATVEALKRFMRIPVGSAADDEELERALETASRQIDHLCSRTFEVATTEASVRYFTPWNDSYGGRWRLPVDDFMTDTDLELFSWTDADEAWTTPITGPFTFLPINAAPTMPWNEIVLPSGTSLPRPDWDGWASEDSQDYVAVVARWGWTELPAQVTEACLLQAARLQKRRDAVFGIVAAPDGSAQTRLQDRMDPDAVLALRGLTKWWAAR